MTYYKKQYIADVNVYEAAKERIRIIYNEFEAVNIAFSGGKDSTVLVNLCIDVAKELGKTPVNVFCIDFEALYKSTHDITEYYGNHPDVNLEWICLPIHLRNAVSQFQPHWICWDNTCKDKWIRQLPKKSISDINHYDFFREGMEFENFIEEYAIHKSENGNKKTCTLVGIRSDESLNRFRTIVNSKKSKYKDYQWTTKNSNNVYSAYPIYDWKTSDIWTTM
jgi:predicted phosphoadenosine phosphosulfate sulfurtransferase